MRRYPHILTASALALYPSLALANGLIPAINAYRNTSAFYFVFTGVILFEALCVRLWLRRPHFALVLWRVVVLNAVSSFAGYLLVRSPLRPDFTYVWQQAIPFFFLTLCVELPLVLVLFMRHDVSWKKRLLIGTVANLLSYVFLIAAERPIETVWLERLRADDRQTLSQWVDLEMLASASGRIYGTESGGYHRAPSHRLRFFDLQDRKWHSMTNCLPIHPGFWDVEGNVFAHRHFNEDGYSHQDITVRRLPDFRTSPCHPTGDSP